MLEWSQLTPEHLKVAQLMLLAVCVLIVLAMLPSGDA